MAGNNVNVNITATNKTGKAFGAAGRSMQQLRDQANRVGGSIMKIGGAAMTVAVGAMAKLTAESMASIDALAKTADKLGITTEALAGMQHAANLAGVDSKQLSKAMQSMGVQISNAANGTGIAKKSLEQMGLSAQALSRLPLDKQMMAVADALQEVEIYSDRVRIAQELFGAKGVAVLNMMKTGSAGMREMAAEAEALGISVSRVDAASIENANDAVTRAKGVFEGLGNQLAIAFSPIIQGVADWFRQGALDSAEFGNIGQRVALALVKAWGHLANAWAGLKAGWYLLAGAIISGWGNIIGFFSIGAEKIGGAIDWIIEKYNKVAEFFGMDTIENNVVSSLQAAADGMIEIGNGYIAQAQEILNAPLPSDRVMEAFELMKAKSRETAEAVAHDAEKIRLSTTDANADPKDVVKSTNFITDAKMEGEKKLAEFTKKSAADKAKYVVEQAGTEFSALAQKSKKFFALQKAFNITNAIMNTYAGATKALASYPPPINFAMAALTVANGMGQVAAIRSQSFEGGGFTGYGARAGGLDGKGGYMAMVHPNESIIDHTKGQSMGGAPVNVNFQITAADTRDFDRLLVERRGMIMSMVNQAVNNRGRRSLA